MAALGDAAVLYGGLDDSPGRQLIGGVIIVGVVVLGVKSVRSGRGAGELRRPWQRFLRSDAVRRWSPHGPHPGHIVRPASQLRPTPNHSYAPDFPDTPEESAFKVRLPFALGPDELIVSWQIWPA